MGLRTASIAQLKREIVAKEKRLAALAGRRKRLLEQVSAVDKEIDRLRGEPTEPVTPRPSRSARPKPGRKPKLADAIAAALNAAKGPLDVDAIAERIVKAGYKTRSRNVKNLVREALTRTPGIKWVSRGKYTVK